jgi:hypothetical protein
MHIEKLKQKLDEAIASKKTSDANRKTLVEIREELMQAKNEEQYFSLALKLIELLGALARACIAASG